MKYGLQELRERGNAFFSPLAANFNKTDLFGAPEFVT